MIVALIRTSPITLVLSLLDLSPANGLPHRLPRLFVTGTGSTTLLIIQGRFFSAMLADVVEESYVAAIVFLNVASVACGWMFRITRASHAKNLAILAERRGRHITPPRAQ